MQNHLLRHVLLHILMITFYRVVAFKIYNAYALTYIVTSNYIFFALLLNY